ncbi:hypothetical protein V8C35DRAFT_303126 [Trichoderma chlorosporum]
MHSLCTSTRERPLGEARREGRIRTHHSTRYCCFALLTGLALISNSTVRSTGEARQGKVRPVRVLFTTHCLVACQATRRMTEGEPPESLAEGGCRDRGARSRRARKSKRSSRTDDDDKKRGKGTVGRPCLVLLLVLAGRCWTLGGKGEPLGRMEVSGAAPDWALVRELASIFCCRMAWTTQIGRRLGPFRGGHGLAGGCDCFRMGLSRCQCNALPTHLASRPLATRQPRAPSSL